MNPKLFLPILAWLTQQVGLPPDTEANDFAHWLN